MRGDEGFISTARELERMDQQDRLHWVLGLGWVEVWHGWIYHWDRDWDWLVEDFSGLGICFVSHASTTGLISLDGVGRFVLIHLHSESSLEPSFFPACSPMFIVYDYDLRLPYDCINSGMACLWIIQYS